MATLIISVDDDSIDSDQDTRDVLAPILEPTHTPDENVINPGDVQDLLAALPKEAVEIRRSTHRPDWDHGDPCPDCGNEVLSVMNLDEDIYASVDGEFEFRKKGDALGPQLSVLCPECMTQLAHVPYQYLAV